MRRCQGVATGYKKDEAEYFREHPDTSPVTIKVLFTKKLMCQQPHTHKQVSDLSHTKGISLEARMVLSVSFAFYIRDVTPSMTHATSHQDLFPPSTSLYPHISSTRNKQSQQNLPQHLQQSCHGAHVLCFISGKCPSRLPGVLDKFLFGEKHLRESFRLDGIEEVPDVDVDASKSLVTIFFCETLVRCCSACLFHSLSYELLFSCCCSFRLGELLFSWNHMCCFPNGNGIVGEDNEYKSTPCNRKMDDQRDM